MRNHLAAIVLASSLLSASGARADATFDVSLDTSSISGTDAQLVFELIDGDGVTDNAVSLSNFNLGGGTVAAPADYLGSTGVSGDLSGTVAMDDSAGEALFTQLVDFGSSLTFQMTTSNAFSGIGQPDAFSMLVCAADFSACYSDNVTGALLELDLSGNALGPASFTLNGASAQGLPAPVVTLASVPEPGSLLLLATGLLAVASGRKSRRP